VTYPIPGNDDAARAIQLYCDLIADAVLDGLTEGQVRGGKDIGASERPPVEAVVRERAPAGPVESPLDGPTGANY
jgi:small subunit ribosomal protein S2